MKYAFVSDIHANLQAWQAVWDDALGQGVDQVICLGDVIGYGPRPAETLDAVVSRVAHFTVGNHDAVVAGLLDASCFNPAAQEMITRTAEHLGTDAAELLASMPYSLELDCGDFSAIAVHATMHLPEAFSYIDTEEEARKAWDACEAPLVFVGHTHRPCADMLDPSGNYHRHQPDRNFVYEHGWRCIVNVGSVGLPRTEDIRACYVVYDTDTRRISWHRVDYDVEALRLDVHQCMGDSDEAVRFLAAFDVEAAASLREEFDFSPPTVKRHSIRRARTHVKRMKKSGVARSTVLIFLLTFLIVCIAGTVAYLIWEGAYERRRARLREKAKVIAKRGNLETSTASEPAASSPPLEPIEVVATNFSFTARPGPNVISGFTVAPGVNRKLVLVASWEGLNPGISATWDGKEVFTLADVSSCGRNSAILYLDNPTATTGNIAVSLTGNSTSRVGVLSLTGAAPGVAVTATARGHEASLTTIMPNTLVVGAYTSNKGGTITTTSLNPVYSGQSGSSHAHAGYWNQKTAGLKTYTWRDSNPAGNCNALAGFVPAPVVAKDG